MCPDSGAKACAPHCSPVLSAFSRVPPCLFPLPLWWVISGGPEDLMEIDFQTNLTWASLKHPGFVTWPTS